MKRIDNSTATLDNKFTEGNPSVPTPATVLPAEFMNVLQEELAYIVEQAGGTLDQSAADTTQVYDSVLTLINNALSALSFAELATNQTFTGLNTFAADLTVDAKITAEDLFIADAGNVYEVEVFSSGSTQFKSINGGGIVQLIDAGASNATTANPTLEYRYSSTLGGSAPLIARVGLAATTVPDVYLSALEGDIRFDAVGASQMKFSSDGLQIGTTFLDPCVGGRGQTWQDVSGSRTTGVNYRNTTGRPIELYVNYSTSSSQVIETSPDASSWVQVGGAAGFSCHATIPDDYYYRMTAGTIYDWNELR